MLAAYVERRVGGKDRVQVRAEGDGRGGFGSGARGQQVAGRHAYLRPAGKRATPPRIADPARGTVTGEALIFNSRDDSVSIEGGGRKTTTETTAPKHGQNRQRD